jgi:hypothetical protein
MAGKYRIEWQCADAPRIMGPSPKGTHATKRDALAAELRRLERERTTADGAAHSARLEQNKIQQARRTGQITSEQYLALIEPHERAFSAANRRHVRAENRAVLIITLLHELDMQAQTAEEAAQAAKLAAETPYQPTGIEHLRAETPHWGVEPTKFPPPQPPPPIRRRKNPPTADYVVSGAGVNGKPIAIVRGAPSAAHATAYARQNGAKGKLHARRLGA